MKSIDVRIFHGVFFVTKEQNTMYEGGGIKLVTNVDEIAYFDIVDWIKNDCGCQDVGRIFFRKTNCSLFNGRKEIIDDCEITNFLKSPEKDGWYNFM